VPLFAVLIRAMKKVDSKCRHARSPWCFPVSIWERCEWAIIVCSINPRGSGVSLDAGAINRY